LEFDVSTKMTERENIFARIREALTMASPVPGQHGTAHEPAGLPCTADHRQVLPVVGETFDERLALFARNAGELKAKFILAKDNAALTAELRALRDFEGWKRVAAQRAEAASAAAQALGLPVLFTYGGYDKTELEKCDAGISECDALIAQTGTVVVTSRSAGGRGLSVLPPHHVVIARREQLVPDLPAAFALLKSKYGEKYPSMISFITGPSRTGDIERILVLGAHGPKKLTILCV
jgi:L-lactate dehydrogenase complex protein LldG